MMKSKQGDCPQFCPESNKVNEELQRISEKTVALEVSLQHLCDDLVKVNGSLTRLCWVVLSGGGAIIIGLVDALLKAHGGK